MADWSKRFRDNLQKAGGLEKSVLSDPRAQKAVEEGTRYAHQVGEQAKGYLGQVKEVINEKVHSMPGYTPEAGKNAKKALIGAGIAAGVLFTQLGWIVPFDWAVAAAAGLYSAKKVRDAVHSSDNSPQARYRSKEARRYQGK